MGYKPNLLNMCCILLLIKLHDLYTYSKASTSRRRSNNTNKTIKPTIVITLVEDLRSLPFDMYVIPCARLSTFVARNGIVAAY